MQLCLAAVLTSKSLCHQARAGSELLTPGYSGATTAGSRRSPPRAAAAVAVPLTMASADAVDLTATAEQPDGGAAAAPPPAIDLTTDSSARGGASGGGAAREQQPVPDFEREWETLGPAEEAPAASPSTPARTVVDSESGPAGCQLLSPQPPSSPSSSEDGQWVRVSVERS